MDEAAVPLLPPSTPLADDDEVCKVLDSVMIISWVVCRACSLRCAAVFECFASEADARRSAPSSGALRPGIVSYLRKQRSEAEARP